MKRKGILGVHTEEVCQANSFTPVYLYYDEDGVDETGRWKSELSISLCYSNYANALRMICDIPVRDYNSITIPRIIEVDFNSGKFIFL